jgi:hypothetical protein
MARRGPDQPTKLSAGDVRRNISTIASIPDKQLHLPTKCSGDGRRGPRFQLNRRERSSSRPAFPPTCAGPTRRTHPALCSCTTCRSRSFPRSERCIRRFAMRDKRPKCAQTCGERGHRVARVGLRFLGHEPICLRAAFARNARVNICERIPLPSPTGSLANP